MRRGLAWALIVPLAAAGVLAGHAAAYALTGASLGSGHDYLAHAPQVVAVVALLALLGAAAEGRRQRFSPLPIALFGATAFAVQEHVERIANTGDVPFLLSTPTFLLGLGLQAPLAVLLWLLARRLLSGLRRQPRRLPPALALLPLAWLERPALVADHAPRGNVPARGPPSMLR